MNLPKERETNLINSRDLSGESNEPSTCSWLSGELIESSDESCADSTYEDYLHARNYWNRRNAALAHKEILDRAYRFIYDEAFSSETTNESDCPVEYYAQKEFPASNIQSQCDLRESTMPAGDGKDFFRFKKPDTKYRAEKKRLQLPPNSRQGSGTNSDNLKSRSSPRIFARKLRNFEERCSRQRCERSESFPGSFADDYAQSNSNSDDALNFEDTLRNPNRKIPLKKRLKDRHEWSTNASMRRKRKLPTIEIKDRSNDFQNVERRRTSEIFEARNLPSRISRWPKPRDRSKLNSKTRKIFSEKILIGDIGRGGSSHGNSIDEIFKENNELEGSSSDDSFVVDVDNVLQENLREKNSSRLTVETVLLENNKNRTDSLLRSFRNARPSNESFHRDGVYPIDTHSNEVKLLGDIKKRIDQDFEYDLNEIKVAEMIESISRENEIVDLGNLQDFYDGKITDKNPDLPSVDKVTNASSKSSRQYLVDSIDSGVSTDFSRNESDLSRNFGYPEPTNSGVFIPTDYQISITSDADDEGILDTKVEYAVQRFTEELIMCERRAVERGLVDEVRRGADRKKRKKSPRKVRYSSSSSFSSPRGFFKTSQSSYSEEEYLENISPPSLCSMSDSEMENLSDFHD